MKNKSTNKEAQLRVRLTPHQSFMLDEICKRARFNQISTYKIYPRLVLTEVR